MSEPERQSLWFGVIVGAGALATNVFLGKTVYTLAYQWDLPVWGFVVVTVGWVFVVSPGMAVSAMSLIIWTINGYWYSPVQLVRDGYGVLRGRAHDVVWRRRR